MADVIQLLPESVANQIAAGEVIQRPASVVKELIENAVDAGSTVITVNIQEGGRGLIHVIDNGCGMSENDARLAFARHATSKITKVDDLFALRTFGFRGEALASIASVSEVELRTRRPEEQIGLKFTVEGGHFGDTQPVNIQPGTQFLVKNLFFNVPARRKFLKSKSVEMRHIVDEFQRVALCNPQIEMNLYDDETCRYRLPASNRRMRIVGLMGKHVNGNLLDVTVQTSIISISGFIGTPQSAKKSGAGQQFLFINNRFFRSGYFHKAIVSAYDKLIQDNVCPAYFLYFTVDPSRIDVNIHPTKTEIKFEDEQAIWQIINAAVRESLGKFGAVPMMDFDAADPIDIPVYRENNNPVKVPASSLNPDFNPFLSESDSAESGKRRKNYLQSMSYGDDGVPEGWEILYRDSYDKCDKSTLEGDSFRNFIQPNEATEETEIESMEEDGIEIESEMFLQSVPTPVQSVLRIEEQKPETVSFLPLPPRHAVMVRYGSVYIIDLVRAHRRIMYERFLGDDQTETVNQQDLFAEPVAVSPESIRLLESLKLEIEKAGIELAFGESEVTVTGIPTDLAGKDPAILIDDLIHDLDPVHGLPLQDPKHRAALIKSEMYGASSRKNFRAEEVNHILRELFECNEPAFTATGKPVWTVIPDKEIKQRLK